MNEKIDPRDHIPLSRTMSATDGDSAWAEWQARIDADNAMRQGAPTLAAITLGLRLAEQERILFGRVRTRELSGFGE